MESIQNALSSEFQFVQEIHSNVPAGQTLFIVELCRRDAGVTKRVGRILTIALYSWCFLFKRPLKRSFRSTQQPFSHSFHSAK